MKTEMNDCKLPEQKSKRAANIASSRSVNFRLANLAITLAEVSQIAPTDIYKNDIYYES